MLVLLDRDGVINEDRPDSVRSVDELVLIPGAARAMAQLNKAGIKIAIVTNQSIVGRGIISQDELDIIHAYLAGRLAEEGAHWDALFVCTDVPDQATHRRKPGDGMLREALTQFNAVAADTPMIGDALRDMQAAASAGCPRWLVRTGKGQATFDAGFPDDVMPVVVYKDLAEAADRLIHDVLI